MHSAWYWEQEQPQVLDNLEFNMEIINSFITQIAVHETAWQEFFVRIGGHIGTEPYVVVYEDFVNAYEETAKTILQYLGVHFDEPLVFAPRRLKRQADDLSDEWVQRVIDLYRDSFRM